MAQGGRAVCLLEHARWSQLRGALGSGLEYIHMVRDPLEVCVSGYQYHLNATEPWVLAGRAELGGLSWQRYLRAAPREQGILVECTR